MKPLSGTLGFAAAAALVLGASAALAEVDVTADVDKTKNKDVTETITIEKTILMTPTVTIEIDAAAENEIVKNQDLTNLISDVDDSTSTAEIKDSANDTAETGQDANPSSGVLHFNQSPGNLNNQANDASIAAAGSLAGGGSGTFAHSEVSIQQVIDNSKAGMSEADPIEDRVNQTLIENSFRGANGIIGVNQGAGDINNQQNAVGVAVATEGVLALGEVDLGQAIANAAVYLKGGSRTDKITGGAFDGASGVVQVNQASGYLNNQANVLNVSADLVLVAPPE